MSSQDSRLFAAKDAVTRCLVMPDNRFDKTELAGRIDELNKAWDALTDQLVGQRMVCITIINDLVNQLAEERGRKGR